MMRILPAILLSAAAGRSSLCCSGCHAAGTAPSVAALCAADASAGSTLQAFRCPSEHLALVNLLYRRTPASAVRLTDPEGASFETGSITSEPQSAGPPAVPRLALPGVPR